MITKPFVGVLLAGCAFAAPVAAAGAGCVQVKEGWARLPAVATMPMTAGYATVHNGCDQPVTVIGARSSSFGDVSLHETTVTDGVSRMQHVHQLPIAAGASVELKPGGLHLMLMQGKGALTEGQALPLVLELAGGEEVQGTLQVRAPNR
ncbi:copper chaperone PCu(A)C [Stenotrophomonas tumulicola]|uniref:Copper chaperone PCu(A)C n=1 Tax=Stenotrophomonas tumulicola TaxID=1685415 RepID=A0A7W3IH63_9GAMM|nr:copper chaperone PCu(A)C [Stenotrophomonas tumulicola]MBA8681728.1 copper chaperone PCu(A)C [Stenotrophomonas tumulicola]